MTTRASRAALSFLIIGTLATTALPAASLFEAGASPAKIAALEPLDLLERLLGVVNRWRLKNGCSVDPNGQYVPKNGCQVDPDGRCLPVKNGCQVDPSGRCLPLKNGCQVDPNGRCIS
jgi:hypothetical protein